MAKKFPGCERASRGAGRGCEQAVRVKSIPNDKLHSLRSRARRGWVAPVWCCFRQAGKRRTEGWRRDWTEKVGPYLSPHRLTQGQPTARGKEDQLLTQWRRRLLCKSLKRPAHTHAVAVCCAPLRAEYGRFTPHCVVRIEGWPMICVAALWRARSTRTPSVPTMGKLLLSGSDCDSAPVFS